MNANILNWNYYYENENYHEKLANLKCVSAVVVGTLFDTWFAAAATCRQLVKNLVVTLTAPSRQLVGTLFDTWFAAATCRQLVKNLVNTLTAPSRQLVGTLFGNLSATCRQLFGNSVGQGLRCLSSRIRASRKMSAACRQLVKNLVNTLTAPSRQLVGNWSKT